MNTIRSTYAALAAALPLAACGVWDNMRLQDHSAPTVSVRAVHRLGGGPGGPGIEAGIVSTSANGTQELAADSSIVLGDMSLAGPATLTHRARLQQAHLAYNHLLFAGRPIELEWFVGGSLSRTRWRTTSSTQGDPVLAFTETSYGAVGGAVGRWNLTPSFAIEARHAEEVITSGGLDNGYRGLTELALLVRPAPGLRLRLGAARHRLEFYPENTVTRSIASTRGLFVNLGVEF